MRKTNRLLSCLLVLLMVFSLAPQVFAQSNSRNDAAAQWEQRQWEMNYDEWQRAGGHYHQYTGYTVLTPATCSSYGEAYMYCAICGEPKTEVIQKLPHTWGEWEILLEATDHSAGLRQHTCKVCGTVEQEEFDPEGTIRPGAHGDAVEELQHLLEENGLLDRHMVDRDYGWYTEQAVKEAERDAGMEADGIAWPLVMNHLRHDFGNWKYTVFPSYDTVGHKERTCSKCGYVEKVDIGKKLERGAYGDDVLRLQERLTELGFAIGKPDGSFGRRTQAAIKLIQEIYEFPVDGIVWPGIWEMLFPDEDLRVERDNDGPVRIAGVYLPNWGNHIIQDSGHELVDTDPAFVAKEIPALDVSIRITNPPHAFGYYTRYEQINYEITVTNIGDLPFSNVTLELKMEPTYDGEDFTYVFQTIANFNPGETRTYTPSQTGAFYMFEGQETATTTVTATGTGRYAGKPVVASDEVIYPVGPNPAHAKIQIDSVEWPDTGSVYTEGSEFVFQATITNDGPIPLTHTVVKVGFDNNMSDYTIAESDDRVEPGDGITDTYTYTITKECMETLALLKEFFPNSNFDTFSTFIVSADFSFAFDGNELFYHDHDTAKYPN